MDDYIELSKQLAHHTGTPIVLVLVRQELTAESAAHHERDSDEPPGAGRD